MLAEVDEVVAGVGTIPFKLKIRLRGLLAEFN